MRLPRAPRRGESRARAASRAAGKTRYPLGKALARIRYFERQRGIELTRYERGRVVTATARAVPTKRTKRARSTSARSSRALCGRCERQGEARAREVRRCRASSGLARARSHIDPARSDVWRRRQQLSARIRTLCRHCHRSHRSSTPRVVRGWRRAVGLA